MTLLNDLSRQSLQFYLTEPYPCSYLPGRMARSLMAAPSERVDGRVYCQLVHMGFRRGGLHTYRPQCVDCHACIPVRLDVAAFTPSRSQRRVWKRLAGLSAHPVELRFCAEHYELYRRYQATRHGGGGMDCEDEEQYRRFLLSSNVATQLIEFRDGGILRMVSVVDILPDGLSAVYTFYDPSLPQAGFGTWNVVWQAALCRGLGLPWLYLGFWIANSDKMAYKIKFQPLQGLIGERWQALSSPPEN